MKEKQRRSQFKTTELNISRLWDGICSNLTTSQGAWKQTVQEYEKESSITYDEVNFNTLEVPMHRVFSEPALIRGISLLCILVFCHAYNFYNLIMVEGQVF